jgi:hypothetical protein
MTTETRTRVRELADRLTLEYAGALPPAQVLALVFRAHASLVSLRGLPASTRLEICESVARRLLTDRVASHHGDGAS